MAQVRPRATRGMFVLALVAGSLGAVALTSLGHGGAAHSYRSAHVHAVTLSAGGEGIGKPWMY